MSQDTQDLDALIERIGESYFRQRFNIQVEHASKIFSQGRTLFHIENVEWLMVFIYYALRFTGLYNRGVRNAKAIQVVENEVFLPGLPAEFDGYTLLHLSDLHLDITSGLTEAIIETIKDLRYDLCVITGDYRASTSGSYKLAMEENAKLLQQLPKPVYGILGNHDFIEFAPHLERAGLTMLLNETVPLVRNGATIYLSGVDDPHFYMSDNLHRTTADYSQNAFSILLAHSPEIYRQAAAIGYDFMLSGHTHAGQICLPGRISILNNANCPREFVYGSWQYNEMQGYTSAGTGCCGVPVRFNCPPEATLHRLRRANRKAAPA